MTAIDPEPMRKPGNGRTLLVLVLIMGVLFFGSILFILSRAPHF
jgi:hypothetical protein